MTAANLLRTSSHALLAALLIPIAGVKQSTAGEMKIGETIEITRSHSWCWFPTIHRFRSGELMVGMVLCPDQLNAESTNSGYCISKDGGRTWSPRHTVGQGASHDGAWSEVPDAEDSLWQFGSYPELLGDSTRLRGTLTKFFRGGRASSQDRDVPITLREPSREAQTYLHAYGKEKVPDTRITGQFGGRVWGNIIRGADGELLCTAYFTTLQDAKRSSAAAHAPKDEEIKPDAEAPKGFNRIVLLRSDDGGKSWAERGVIAAVPEGARLPWIGSEGFNEGTLSLLPDRRLYAVYRSGGLDGMIGHGWSSDGGKTWTAPASIGFHGVAPRLRRLSSGALALATGRPGPVELRLNSDGHGAKWSKPVTIFTGKSTRYCDTVEVEPGRLLVVYDSVPYGWHPIPFSDRNARNRILGTFVQIGEGAR
ncbi:MAG: sialidase family protein [Chthoniobacteraceae bacterium]